MSHFSYTLGVVFQSSWVFRTGVLSQNRLSNGVAAREYERTDESDPIASTVNESSVHECAEIRRIWTGVRTSEKSSNTRLLMSRGQMVPEEPSYTWLLRSLRAIDFCEVVRHLTPVESLCRWLLRSLITLDSWGVFVCMTPEESSGCDDSCGVFFASLLFTLFHSLSTAASRT